MPIAAAVPAIIGAGASLAGGIGGALNTRPPGLSPGQQNVMDSLTGGVNSLPAQIQKPIQIDPTLQSQMFDQLARSQVGVNNNITHTLTGAGLGHSGLLANALTQGANQLSANQAGTNLSLLQQAYQQHNTAVQQALALMGVNNTPGQSGASGFFSGISGPLAYMAGKQMNSGNGNTNNGNFQLPPDFPGIGA